MRAGGKTAALLFETKHTLVQRISKIRSAKKITTQPPQQKYLKSWGTAGKNCSAQKRACVPACNGACKCLHAMGHSTPPRPSLLPAVCTTAAVSAAAATAAELVLLGRSPMINHA